MSALVKTSTDYSFSEQNKIILVILHKPYKLPSFLPIYKTIQVGSGRTINAAYLRDNCGNHIAEKNASFCELTALYWAWKNLNVKVFGLCHYRRYFGSTIFWVSRLGKKKQDQILRETQISTMLKGYDVILPRKRHYWIETRESQYAHAHHIEDLQVTEQVLSEKYPSYLSAWKHMLASRSGHICNMFIMRKELADKYCEWLFDILFEVEKRLDISSYSEKDKRVFGYLGERLLDVWIETKGLRFTEVPMINLERQHWARKIFRFIQRKITGGEADPE